MKQNPRVRTTINVSLLTPVLNGNVRDTGLRQSYRHHSLSTGTQRFDTPNRKARQARTKWGNTLTVYSSSKPDLSHSSKTSVC
jgi:hypothetical protein